MISEKKEPEKSDENNCRKRRKMNRRKKSRWIVADFDFFRNSVICIWSWRLISAVGFNQVLWIRWTTLWVLITWAKIKIYRPIKRPTAHTNYINELKPKWWLKRIERVGFFFETICYLIRHFKISCNKIIYNFFLFNENFLKFI